MAIAFINSTTGPRATAQTTHSIVPHSSREGGAAFMIGMGLASSDVTVSTITDNVGNLYLRAVARGTPKPAAGAELWYATNISSGSTRIDITLSGNSSGSIAFSQFRGVSTANALLNTAAHAITGNSTRHSAAPTDITPTESSALVVAFHRTNASTMVPISVLGGMSVWASTQSTGAVRTVGLYEIQTAASTVSGTWLTAAATSTGTCMHAAVIAAFSDTAAPPPPGGGGTYTVMLLGVQ